MSNLGALSLGCHFLAARCPASIDPEHSMGWRNMRISKVQGVDRPLRRAMLKFMQLRRVYNIEQRLLDPPPIPEAHCDFAAKS
jgi:hypothetical protein